MKKNKIIILSIIVMLFLFYNNINISAAEVKLNSLGQKEVHIPNKDEYDQYNFYDLGFNYVFSSDVESKSPLQCKNLVSVKLQNCLKDKWVFFTVDSKYVEKKSPKYENFYADVFYLFKFKQIKAKKIEVFEHLDDILNKYPFLKNAHKIVSEQRYSDPLEYKKPKFEDVWIFIWINYFIVLISAILIWIIINLIKRRVFKKSQSVKLDFQVDKYFEKLKQDHNIGKYKLVSKPSFNACYVDNKKSKIYINEELYNSNNSFDICFITTEICYSNLKVKPSFLNKHINWLKRVKNWISWSTILFPIFMFLLYFKNKRFDAIASFFMFLIFIDIVLIYSLIANFLIFICKFKVRNISWNYLRKQKFVTEQNKKQIKTNLDAIMWNEKLPKLYKKNNHESNQKRNLQTNNKILEVFITSAVIAGFSDSYNDIYASYEDKNPIAEMSNSNFDITDGGGDSYSSSDIDGGWNSDSSSDIDGGGWDSDSSYDSGGDWGGSDSSFDGGGDW